jgi:hypothetical protein
VTDAEADTEIQEPSSIPELLQAICARYGTVHRFCRRHKGRLNRSTVYMVLAGTYPGSKAAQALRIAEALGLAQGQEARVLAAIKGVACARCSVKARPCGRCDELFKAQAAAALHAMPKGQ